MTGRKTKACKALTWNYSYFVWIPFSYQDLEFLWDTCCTAKGIQIIEEAEIEDGSWQKPMCSSHEEDFTEKSKSFCGKLDTSQKLTCHKIKWYQCLLTNAKYWFYIQTDVVIPQDLDVHKECCGDTQSERCPEFVKCGKIVKIAQ